MSQHHMNKNINSNNTNSFNNVWNNCTVANEKSEILGWPSPLKPKIRHHDIQTRRSTRWNIGSYRLRNVGIGLVMSMGAILVVQPCSATGVPELAKRTLGEREKILEERNVLLIGRDVSSLVVDTLCK